MTGAPEWDLVIPHFPPRYHLLVPDIPLHNHSRNLPLDPNHPAADTANLLRDLIAAAATDGVAHVVGVSMGAHIGRRLAVQCPRVVRTCFLSGYSALDWIPWKDSLAYIVYAVEYVGAQVPARWIDGIGYATATATPRGFAHFKKVWALIMDAGGEDVRERGWEARTLVVAACKGGVVVRTDDSVKDARALGELARRGNGESRVVRNGEMRHAWSRQDPELFARTVVDWIEGRALPDGFEDV
jgi:pimeloyl-ACP methyl ester carboxylesterase